MKQLTKLSIRHSLTRMLLACLLVCFSAQAGTSDVAQKRVLVLHGHRIDAQTTIVAERAFQKILSEGVEGYLDYYSEYIDLVRFSDPGYESALVDFLRRKYAGRRIDLIITVNGLTLDFVERHSAALFPGAPVVFLGHGSSAIEDLRSRLNCVGFVESVNLKGTLDLALKLQPGVRQVVVVSGVSNDDQRIESVFRQQSRDLEGRLIFTYLSSLPLKEIQYRVANLPNDSMIYYLSLSRDVEGNRFLAHEAVQKVASVANVPVYIGFSGYLNSQVIGGNVLDIESLADRTAELALRVLRGENPNDIPIIEWKPNVNILNWRQLKRWGISEDRLPPGSIVQFKELTLWEEHKWLILGVILFCFVETLLIAGLLLQRSRRGRAERALRESERSLRKSHDRIEDLAGRLIVAQEEERRNIARELHDDLNQQVAALGIGISRLKREFPDAAVQEQIARLQGKTNQLSDRIRQLSHGLHSSILQHVGLAAALKSYCAEFSSQEGIAIDLGIQDGAEAAPPDAALCLYRITQESLRNIAKHSGAQGATVALAVVNGSIELRVADQGVGFNPEQAQERRGLGLVSMEERVKALDGSFELTTRPGAGTQLKAQIPLRRKEQSA